MTTPTRLRSEPAQEPPISRPAPLARRVLAHGFYETGNVLRNGEQLLVSLILPILVLFGAHRLDLLSGADVPGIDLITPGVLALAVMASAFTGQGIATGFERQYGVLAYLSTTPLGPVGLILGKAVAVMGVVLLQLLVIGAVGLALGWSPEPGGLIWLVLGLVTGAAAFTALGLLLAGTVRAEATLAVTNVVWVLLGAVGGSVFPLSHDGAGALLLALPSAALGETLRTAAMTGAAAPIPLLILAGWTMLAVLAARRWFRWR
ncbi:ABC transporter permease [Nesterenkonia marinintestina]|uniref:ABC transporter permease n=1 Tax=Nesterenkonia marinintestina TaxID=2979865 RepID=UPI0021C05D48|nr:ABC transporter permease [Nesterenkonia sp. GX14115]